MLNIPEKVYRKQVSIAINPHSASIFFRISSLPQTFPKTISTGNGSGSRCEKTKFSNSGIKNCPILEYINTNNLLSHWRYTSHEKSLFTELIFILKKLFNFNGAILPNNELAKYSAQKGIKFTHLLLTKPWGFAF